MMGLWEVSAFDEIDTVVIFHKRTSRAVLSGKNPKDQYYFGPDLEIEVYLKLFYQVRVRPWTDFEYILYLHFWF